MLNQNFIVILQDISTNFNNNVLEVLYFVDYLVMVFQMIYCGE